MFSAALFEIAKTWKQPKQPSVYKQVICNISTQCNATQQLKGMDYIDTGNNIDESK